MSSGTCSETIVRGLQQLGEQREADAERVFLVGRQPVDVVILDAHVERLGAARDLLADIAEPDDAERLVLELVELGRVEIVAAPAPGDDAVMHPDQLARHRQHQHHRVLGDRGRVGAAIVADRHAGGARGVEVVGVVAGAQGLHELQLRRLGVEFRAVLELAGADVELGVLQQVPEFRPAMRRGDQLVARRQTGRGRSRWSRRRGRSGVRMRWGMWASPLSGLFFGAPS